MTDEELATIQKVVTKAVEGVETKLAASLSKAIEGINTKIDLNAAAAGEIQSTVKVALEAMPHLIKEHVEGELQTNLKGIVEEVGKQFEGKFKAMTGSGAGSGDGMNLNNLLAHSEQIIGVINAFRSPTTEAAMLSQMNFVMKWHSLLSKLEKGGGAPDEVTKAIASTFTEKQE